MITAQRAPKGTSKHSSGSSASLQQAKANKTRRRTPNINTQTQNLNALGETRQNYFHHPEITIYCFLFTSHFLLSLLTSCAGPNQNFLGCPKFPRAGQVKVVCVTAATPSPFSCCTQVTASLCSFSINPSCAHS